MLVAAVAVRAAMVVTVAVAAVAVAAVAVAAVAAATAEEIKTDGGEVAMETAGDLTIATGPAGAPMQCQ